MKRLPFTVEILLTIAVLGGIGMYVLRDNSRAPFRESRGSLDQATNLTSEEKYTAFLTKSADQRKLDSDVYNEAYDENNAALCDRIISTDIKADCKTRFVMKVAIESRNIGQCDTLVEKDLIISCKDKLFHMQALSYEDTSLCEKIVDREKTASCLEEVSKIHLYSASSKAEGGTSLCANLTGSTYEACRLQSEKEEDTKKYQKAKDIQDLTLCKAIVTPEISTLCLDNITLEMAIEKKDARLCASISDVPKRSLCLEKQSQTNDSNFYKEAIQKSDIAECKNITREKLAEQCHDIILISEIRSSGNSTLCDSLYDTGSIAKCRTIQSNE